MIDATGTITAHDGVYAIVRMDEAGCGRCHEEGGCGGANIGKMLCSTPRAFRVLNPQNTPVGNRVTIMIAEGAVRRGAFLGYGLPLITLFIGAMGGMTVAGEAGAIAGAVIGLLMAWAVLRCYQCRTKSEPRFQPYIRC